ncbi:cobalamin B12-binding domain-containing protein [Thalassococcus sp. BH17M4-6]|uniref:cobalamin B12-binding domain-containing protein n=1 Tax=Thalassococcus sp. BH17M4-6 TaxID=3413148 RepID=UPI003BED69DE
MNETYTDDRQTDARDRADISVLASAVISALSDKNDEGCRTVRSSVVQMLVEATLATEEFDAATLLQQLRTNRVGPDQTVDIYIPEAARRLGQMWVDDVISFAHVTIATARLQGLLTILAPPWSFKAGTGDQDIQMLLILQADDSHTLGPHVAAAQLRRLGASVRILFGPDSATLMQVLSEDIYDLVMFSTSRADALAPIAKLVKRIRATSNIVPPLVLGGLVCQLTDGVKEKTGVDLVTTDARAAFKLCESKRHKTRSVAQ